MLILVVRDTILDIAFQAVDSKVHFCQADGGRILLLPVKGNAFLGDFMHSFNKVSTLNEHAARSAGGIQNLPVIRFNDIDNHLHKRHWSKKFTVIVCLLIRKLGEEIFVNTAKNIPGSLFECWIVECPQQLPQHVIAELQILALWRNPTQCFIVLFYRFHRINDGL